MKRRIRPSSRRFSDRGLELSGHQGTGRSPTCHDSATARPDPHPGPGRLRRRPRADGGPRSECSIRFCDENGVSGRIFADLTVEYDGEWAGQIEDIVAVLDRELFALRSLSTEEQLTEIMIELVTLPIVEVEFVRSESDGDGG